ncbi:hypothetical protein ACFOEQ_09635 [Chryseobacterium arachidis]|uniref:hypothetical protein n=1 Tax=Chryseobacterium arachidis TaxID=1416778 RepID=UPI0036168D0E
MKNITVFASLLWSQIIFSQVSGNVNYRNQTHYSESNISVATPVFNPNINENVISVKGLANVKADQYVAIFSITQVAESAEEVNDLIDKRINTSLLQIKMRKVLKRMSI